MENTQNWKDLWLKNYNNQGDCEGLEKFTRTLDFGAKKDAFYLPWAVVERIFQLQDGKIELLKATDETVVEVDKCYARHEVNPVTGEVSIRHSYSFFINVAAEWKGRRHVERYPLQDSSGRPLASWTQNDLNRAFQRAKVKAIAIVSGIGYKWFENYDAQFEEVDKTPKGLDKAKKLAEQTKPVQKPVASPKVEDIVIETVVSKTSEKPNEETTEETVAPVEIIVTPEIPVEKPSENPIETPVTPSASGNVKETLETNEKDETIDPARLKMMIEAIKIAWVGGNNEKREKIKSICAEFGTFELHKLNPQQIEKIYLAIQ